MTERELTRAWTTAELINFVAYFFYARYRRKFRVSAHHLRICNELQDVVEGRTKNLIINIAPRYSKTELVSINFPAFCYALNPSCKFIETSYSADLTARNSMSVKSIMETPEYRSLFAARIQEGDNTKGEWGTEQGGTFYATSTLGQITGFGAGDSNEAEGDRFRFSGCIIIDDPIKPVDALSDTKRDAINDWFWNTLVSRKNNPSTTPVVVIMQRMHEDDLCGMLERAGGWKVVSLPALYEDENGEERALWPDKHDVPALYELRQKNTFVFETQYQQNPKPQEGLLYRPFKTYDPDVYTLQYIRAIDRHATIRNMTDSADTGSDFHCSIDYIETRTACYVLNVLYTDEPMEKTEARQADMMVRDNVEQSTIEGNNGGRIYARNVERIVRGMGNMAMRFTTYAQTKNKDVRIFTNSDEVNNLILFPEGWERRWPAFSAEVTGRMKEGHARHDDGCDVLTSINEHHMHGSGMSASDFF